MTPSLKVTLMAYLPLPMPYLYHDAFTNNMYNVLDEIKALSGHLPMRFHYGNDSSLSVKSVDGSDVDVDLAGFFGRDYQDRNEILRCATTTSVPPRILEAFSSAEDDELDRSVRTLLTEEYEKRLYDMVYLANLAAPGSVELGRGIVTAGDGWRRTYHSLAAWTMREAVTKAADLNWPAVRRLPFNVIWGWGEELDGFVDGFSDSRLTRALNALTHIMDGAHSDPLIHLLWAMVGIEALYSRGHQSVMEQLRDKCRLFLGGENIPLKLFTNMYDFRSAFVHGRKNFRGLQLLGDARPEVEKFESELWDTTRMAIAILVASLQELAQRGWKDLRFDYTVADEGA